MNNNSYRFKVGSFDCIAVSDGTFTYPDPLHLLFPTAPAESRDQALRRQNIDPGQWTEWVSPYICLAINTGRHQVLVDTGAGGLGPNTGRLIPNLKAEGIEPEDIDTVVISHAHPDHIGGNIDAEGKPAFSKARYVMWKDEWNFWTSKPSLAELDVAEHLRELLVQFANKCLPPIGDQLDLVDHETEIVPGIQAVAAAGHTPGHMALAISSGGEQSLFIGDTVVQPAQIEHSDWNIVTDFLPEKAVATRGQLLGRAAAEDALVLVFHFAFPGLGHVIKEGTSWRWQTIDTTS